MPHTVKRTLVWGFWIFIIYAIVTNPDTSAEMMRNVWKILTDGMTAIMQFVSRLAGR